MTNKQLWTRWTLANAFSEMLGLGLTFAITGLYFSRAGEGTTVLAILISFVVAVASGAVEATFVGLAQWWAMRPRSPPLAGSNGGGERSSARWSPMCWDTCLRRS